MKGKKLNHDSFIEKAKEVHNNKYDYSNTFYTSCKIKVSIICPIHGEFLQSAQSHSVGRGCQKCSKAKIRDVQRIDTKDFLNKVKTLNLHNLKYDYSLVEYINNNTKIKIICPDHGVFEQTPRSHLTYGCDKCHTRGYGLSKWIKLYFKNGRSVLYVVRLFNENENFIKIGITTRSIEIRFKKGKNKIPYDYELLKLEEGVPDTIWDEEKILHRVCKKFKYKPKLNFGGSNECFTLECLSLLEHVGDRIHF